MGVSTMVQELETASSYWSGFCSIFCAFSLTPSTPTGFLVVDFGTRRYSNRLVDLAVYVSGTGK